MYGPRHVWLALPRTKDEMRGSLEQLGRLALFLAASSGWMGWTMAFRLMYVV